jgi:hypothetical protein
VVGQKSEFYVMDDVHIKKSGIITVERFELPGMFLPEFINCTLDPILSSMRSVAYMPWRA